MTGLTFKEYTVEELEGMLNEKNPRWMPEQQKEALEGSLGRFGLVEPIVVNTRLNRVIGGHQRIAASRALKIATLTAVVLDLDEVQDTALNLALNKVRGYWDYDKLAQVLADISSENLLLTGFTEVEAESIIASGSVEPDDIADDEPLIDGIVQDIRNRTETEVKELFEATEKVQFGMFARHVPVDEYEAWVAALEAKSQNGTSPAALGAVVCAMLGIEAYQPSADEGDELSAPDQFQPSENDDDEFLEDE